MQTLIERGCGLDVHQATVVACLLMVRRDGKVQKQMRTFGTTTRELVGLREWLLSEGCTARQARSAGLHSLTACRVLESSIDVLRERYSTESRRSYIVLEAFPCRLPHSFRHHFRLPLL